MGRGSSIGRTASWRTRTAYLQGGLDFPLHDEARPGKPKQDEADAEAQIAVLTCLAVRWWMGRTFRSIVLSERNAHSTLASAS
jgi:hypothetical protein